MTGPKNGWFQPQTLDNTMKYPFFQGLAVSLLLLALTVSGQAAELLLFYSNDVQGELEACG